MKKLIFTILLLFLPFGVMAQTAYPVSLGGTGTSTHPTVGQILYGNIHGLYDLVNLSSVVNTVSNWLYNSTDTYLTPTTSTSGLLIKGTSTLATTTISNLCLFGDCKTSWPSVGGAVTWLYNTISDYLSPATSTSGVMINGTTTVGSDFIVKGPVYSMSAAPMTYGGNDYNFYGSGLGGSLILNDKATFDIIGNLTTASVSSADGIEDWGMDLFSFEPGGGSIYGVFYFKNSDFTDGADFASWLSAVAGITVTSDYYQESVFVASGGTYTWNNTGSGTVDSGFVDPPTFVKGNAMYVDHLTGSTIVTTLTETNPTLLKLDQTVPQIFTAGTVTGSGLLSVTSGELGLDNNTYLTTESDPISVHLDQSSPQTMGGLADGYLILTGGVIGTGGISGYVPYTGATASVDLGVWNLTVNGIIASSSNTLSIDPNNRKLYSTNGSVGLDYSKDGSLFGADAVSAYGGNYIIALGSLSGGDSTNSFSNFIGYQTGMNADHVSYSNFIGVNAGVGNNNTYSNFIGFSAGDVSDVTYGNFIGAGAGIDATMANHSNFLGFNAGNLANNSSDSNFIGTLSGYYSPWSNNSNFIGYYAGAYGTSSPFSDFIGEYAGYGAQDSDRSVFIGNYAGYLSINSPQSVFIGNGAGIGSHNDANAIFIGAFAGRNETYLNNLQDGAITSLSIVDGGLNYTDGNIVTIVNGHNPDARATVTGVNASGTVTSLTLKATGFLYTVSSPYATATTSPSTGAGLTISVNSVHTGNDTSIAIGSYSGTGGFPNSIAIGHGVYNSTSTQANIGNVLFLNGIYNSDTSSYTPLATGRVGIGTNAPHAKLQIQDGDIYMASSTRGIILTSPNGSCFRTTVTNLGVLTVSTAITCP